MLVKIGLLILIISVVFIAVGYLYRRSVLLRKNYQNINEYFNDVYSVINSVRYGNLSVRVGENTQSDLSKLTDSINRMIETIYDRETMIAEYRTELTKKNNFLGTIFDSLSDGLLVCDDEFIIIDANT